MSSIPAFDTLKFTKQLQNYDYSVQQAEGLVEAIVTIYGNSFETVRADIKAQDDKLAKFSDKLSDLEHGIKALDLKFTTKLMNVERDIKAIDVKFTEKLNNIEIAFDAKLTNKLEALESRLDKKIEVTFNSLETRLIKWTIGSMATGLSIFSFILYRLIG